MTEQDKINFALEEARGGFVTIELVDGIATLADSDGSDSEPIADDRDEIERQVARRFG